VVHADEVACRKEPRQMGTVWSFGHWDQQLQLRSCEMRRVWKTRPQNTTKHNRTINIKDSRRKIWQLLSFSERNIWSVESSSFWSPFKSMRNLSKLAKTTIFIRPVLGNGV